MKFLKAILAVTSLLVLTACGKTESKTYQNSNLPTGSSNVTIFYKDDEALKLAVKNTIVYEKLVMTANDPGPSKAEVEKLYQPQVKQYEGISGVTHDFQFGKTEAVETLTIDYQKLNRKQLREKELPILGVSLSTEDAKDKVVSYDQVVELLEKSGYTLQE